VKFLVVGYVHRSNDKRVLRSVKALKKLGKVYFQYVESDIGDDSEIPNDVEKIPLRYPPKSTNPIHWYRKWRKFDTEITKLVLDIKPDVLYFHNIPHTHLSALKVAKDFKTKIIVDLHEVIPHQYMQNNPFYLVFRYMSWRKLKKVFKILNGLIGVSEDAIKFMIRKTKVNVDIPYLTVPNYADFSTDPLPLEKRSKAVAIVGVSSRGEMKSKSLFYELHKKGFEIVFIGKKVNNDEFLFPVKSLGFLPYDIMMKEVSQVIFTIILFDTKSLERINLKFSLPNRFFDSIAAGTPVIVDKRNLTMSKLVNKDKIGIVIDQFNLNEVIEKLEEYMMNYDANINILKVKQNYYVWNSNKENEFLRFVENIINKSEERI